MRTSLKSHPKVNEIAAMLENPADGSEGFNVSVGGQRSALHAIWSAANEHTSDGVFHNVDLSYLDVLAEFDGFGKAMTAVGWAIFDSEYRCVILPDFCENNVPVCKRASTGAERQRRYRERQKAKRDVTVTLDKKRKEDLKQNTHRARNFQDSVDNSGAEQPKPQTGQGLTAVQGGQQGLVSPPESSVTGRNRNASGVTHCDALSDQACNAAPPSTQERFAMYSGWQPSPDLIQIAAEAGLKLDKPSQPAQIAEFRAFWRSEGKQFRQTQWDLKLAQRLAEGQKCLGSRASPRDVNSIPDTCYEIPEGFRGG